MTFHSILKDFRTLQLILESFIHFSTYSVLFVIFLLFPQLFSVLSAALSLRSDAIVAASAALFALCLFEFGGVSTTSLEIGRALAVAVSSFLR